MTTCRFRVFRYLLGAAAILAIGASGLTACGDGSGGDPTPRPTRSVSAQPTATAAPDPTATPTLAPAVVVDVYHGEWDLYPSVDSVPAGTVTFNATNDGEIPHNFRLARTDLADDALPMDPATYLVKEEELDMVAKTEDILVGESKVVTVALEPGNYVLFCNVKGHYNAGLHAPFTVE